MEPQLSEEWRLHFWGVRDSPEDLVIMKALAQRPRDLGDIESVIDANPDIDLDRVRDWLRKFSAVLDRPDIQEEFERILKRR